MSKTPGHKACGVLLFYNLYVNANLSTVGTLCGLKGTHLAQVHFSCAFLLLPFNAGNFTLPNVSNVLTLETLPCKTIASFQRLLSFRSVNTFLRQ